MFDTTEFRLSERDFLREVDKISTLAVEVFNKWGSHAPTFLLYCKHGRVPITPDILPPPGIDAVPVGSLRKMAEEMDACAIIYIGEVQNEANPAQRLFTVSGKHLTGWKFMKFYDIGEGEKASITGEVQMDPLQGDDSGERTVLDKILLTKLPPPSTFH